LGAKGLTWHPQASRVSILSSQTRHFLLLRHNVYLRCEQEGLLQESTHARLGGSYVILLYLFVSTRRRASATGSVITLLKGSTAEIT